MSAKILAIAILSILVCGCNTSDQCRGSSHDPKMTDEVFPDAMRFQAYSKSVSIENIGYFTHHVDKVEGHLPNGLECTTTSSGFKISGTPTTENGNFEFRVIIYYSYDSPSDGEDDSTVVGSILFPDDCDGKISHNYRIHVN